MTNDSDMIAHFFLLLISVIVFENGKSGFLGEHSCMDGTPTLRMTEFLLASLAQRKVDLGPSTVSSSLPPPTELPFALNGANLKQLSRYAISLKANLSVT